jgi:hypothetical protein
MKRIITLDVNHSQKSRVEYFLNNVHGDLEPIPFDVRELSHVDDIIAGFKFKKKDHSTFVIVIFAKSYFHASDISAANSGTLSKIKWTINGDILFGVESNDAMATSEMLGFFAGKE